LPRRSFLADSTNAKVPMLEDREKLAREHVRNVKKNAPWLFEKEASQRFYRARMVPESVEMLVALAREGDKDAVEILRDHARAIAGTDEIAPRCFHEFVWEWFIDGPPKANPGSSPKDTGLRDLAIAMLVNMVGRDYGFPEYRNPEHRGEKGGPMSACLLVAQETGLSERTVEKIWADRKEMILRRRSPA
jgi:hypothetical protein